MTEQQIWFFMIFSIPFPAAVVVFLIIKPRIDDAGVESKVTILPFLPQMRINLAGGIATYLVIVLLGIIAYLLIIKNDTIALILEPVDRAGGRLDYTAVNLERTGHPIVHVERFDSPDAEQTTLTAFDITRLPFLFRSAKSLWVSRDLHNKFLRVQIDRGSIFAPAEYRAQVKEDAIVVAATVQEDFMADWIALVDVVAVDISPTDRVVRIRRTTLVKDGSERGLTNMDLGAISLDGLRRAELQIDEIVPKDRLELENELDNMFGQRSSATDLGDDLANLLTNAEKHSLFIDSSQWTHTGQKPFEALVLGSINAGGQDVARFLFAPAPRIKLNAASPGSLYLLHLSSEIEQRDAANGINLPLDVDMKFPTKQFIAQATLPAGIASFSRNSPVPEKTIPSHETERIATDRTVSRSAFRLLWASDLPRLSRIFFPLRTDAI